MRLPMVLLIAAALFAVSIAAPARSADTGPSPVAAAPDLKPVRDKIAAGDHAGAIPLLAAVLKEHPDDADANNLMGFALRKTGKWKDALTHYQKALSVDPKHLGANEYLGELYAEQGDLPKAKERLAVLKDACKDCNEAKELAAAIDKAEKK